MKILQAVPQDLVEVLFLLKVCVSDMNNKGQKHWNNAYPGNEYIISSIDKQSLYLLKDNNIAKGMVVLTEEEPEGYENIEWQGKSDKVLFIRFLAVHPLWQDKGIAKELMDFCETHAKENGYTTMRIDVYSGVEGAENICMDKGFSKTGQFHSQFQQAPYLAYEKSL